MKLPQLSQTPLQPNSQVVAFLILTLLFATEANSSVTPMNLMSAIAPSGLKAVYSPFPASFSSRPNSHDSSSPQPSDTPAAAAVRGIASVIMERFIDHHNFYMTVEDEISGQRVLVDLNNSKSRHVGLLTGDYVHIQVRNETNFEAEQWNNSFGSNGRYLPTRFKLVSVDEIRKVGISADSITIRR
jgi:hypothetical protein